MMENNTSPPAALQARFDALQQKAGQLEEVLTHAEAILHAIDEGSLLAAAPAQEDDANRHNTACYLLDMLQLSIRQIRAGDEP